MITLREGIDMEQKNEVLMFANFPCMFKLLLCRFQDTAVIRKFSFHNLSYYRVVSNIYQLKGTIMQIENQLIKDCNGTRTHNHLVCKRTLTHLAKLTK